jgi:hypothetical protein
MLGGLSCEEYTGEVSQKPRENVRLALRSSNLYLFHNQNGDEMIAVTVVLPDVQVERVEELAGKFHTRPEELVAEAVDEYVKEPHETFLKIAEEVLETNAEFCQRLARHD